MDIPKYIRETVFLVGDFPLKVSFWQGKDFEDQQPAYHSELELQIVLQGTCRYFVHDTRYLLEKNSVLLIHNNEVHNYVSEAGVSIKVYTLIFSPRILSGRNVAQKVLDSLSSTSHLMLSEGQAAVLTLILRDLCEECRDQNEYWQEVVIGHLERLLITLHRVTSIPNHHSREANPFLQGIIEYLQSHITDALSLKEVADHFGMSSSHLSRVFKQYVGLGFKEYIIHLRVVEARRLLEETNLKISSIAHSVGFDDISNFHHRFRSLIGVSPGAYRSIRRRNAGVQENLR